MAAKFVRKTIAEQKAEAAATVAQLHAKVAELVSGDEWKAYLAEIATFRSYSPRNVMLLLMQWEIRRADDPSLPALSLPAAHSVWSAKGGHVRKGQKGLAVLVPMTIRVENETTGETEPRCVGFKLVRKTFDVAQIDGLEDMPKLIRPEIVDGAGDNAVWASLVGIAQHLGFAVEVTDKGLGEANGVCSYTDRKLSVRASMPAAQQLKTLTHELAHAMLHDPAEYAEAHRGSTHRREVEAESVAFTVMSMLGFDTTGYSLPYVAGWSKGNGELIASTAERVVAAATAIVNTVEGAEWKAPRIKSDKPKEVAAA